MKVLFATSEAYPLSKTGGLGDVCGSLPPALQRLGADVRLVLPAYQHALERAQKARPVGEVRVAGCDRPLAILETTLPERDVPVWLVSAPWLFDHRAGTPYHDPDGREWHDNGHRFATFCRAVEALALGRAGLDWVPDLVHGHDWTVGLLPALLTRAPRRPATVFTIHNLAHQGVFSRATFDGLGLPPEWWSLEALEFYGNMSFLKGGLVYSDWLTTVSPTYAREICRAELGCGLDGLLRHRRSRLVGILNGADYEVWNPAHDPLIASAYSADTIDKKAQNKRALQRLFGFAETPGTPLLAHVARLVDQKGIDLLLEVVPRLLARKVQLVVLGRGEQRYAHALVALAAKHPQQVAAYVGYSEELAHRITAGGDAFLMPSRFEPCGLNQMYALRYGTLPVVRRTGGLADTVVDAGPAALSQGTATGFQFEAPTADALLAAITRALEILERDPAAWRRMMVGAMRQDFGWERGARGYLDLYRRALGQQAEPRPSSQRLRRVTAETERVRSGRVPLPPATTLVT